MAKEIAGKVFQSCEEAGLEPLSVEELERAREMFAEAAAARAGVRPEDMRPASPKFYDDTSGTEFEEW
ncbi:hypothetical protein [Nocardia sp. NPDC049149]|uniref:hypothetical protein n=1 Tax=Nocardia sp. NPDC049149 TaxID=3364315 RepID=UPI00371D983C